MKAFPRRGFTKKFPMPGVTPLYIQEQDGMDLRDYFAAKAMAALISFGGWRPMFYIPDSAEGTARESVAAGAYLYADAMLKERERK